MERQKSKVRKMELKAEEAREQRELMREEGKQQRELMKMMIGSRTSQGGSNMGDFGKDMSGNGHMGNYGDDGNNWERYLP